MGERQSARDVLDGVIEAIEPAREAEGELARLRVEQALGEGGREGEGLGGLVKRLVAARHEERPRVRDLAVLVCAADHGVAGGEDRAGVRDQDQDQDQDQVGDRGRVGLGRTGRALKLLARGEGALGAAARQVDASLVVVDCGVRGGDRLGPEPGLLAFRIGDGTADFLRQPAMTSEDALASVQTGVALVYSLGDAGLDLLALGQLGAGAAEACGAVVSALTGADPETLGSSAEVVARALRARRPDPGDPFGVLASVGGFELGVLAGAILGAASIRVPVVLDDQATSAAALLTTRLAPAATGYLIAAHGGGAAAHRIALEALGLAPLARVGLSSGAGTGAALALPMIRAAARVLGELRLE